MSTKPETPALPESLKEAHEEIDRLVGLLHRQQQDLVRSKRTVELLRRVPPELAERVSPALIEAMARREGEKAAREEAARQERELPQLLSEMMRRAEVRHPKAAGEQGSV
jgi:Lon protease-like protein